MTTEDRIRWTSGGLPVPYEPVIENPQADHQIVLRFESGTGNILVSCNCLLFTGGPAPLRYSIESRKIFPVPDAIAAWRRYHFDTDGDGRPQP